MTIIIPMAGLSNRFVKEGFTVPKYMLYVKNRSLFYLSIIGFKLFFNEFLFVFITRNVFDSKTFIEKECELLGIRNFKIIVLDQPTLGQAETVFIGINELSTSTKGRILIHNIDTFKSGYIIPEDIENWDGYLEVFEGDGENWSYAKTENELSTKVISTAEKKQISQFCSTGLYYFKSIEIFNEAYNSSFFGVEGERYVAPMYNYLIDNGYSIHINKIDVEDIVFCGVPIEYYEQLRKTNV